MLSGAGDCSFELKLLKRPPTCFSGGTILVMVLEEVAHIPTGKSPSAIGIDEIAHRIYVANEGDDTISVIDGQKNTKIKDIPVGGSPSVIGYYYKIYWQ